MKVLANSSDRITIEDKGRTFEGRSLLLLLLLKVTSSENHKNIQSIRLNHLKGLVPFQIKGFGLVRVVVFKYNTNFRVIFLGKVCN